MSGLSIALSRLEDATNALHQAASAVIAAAKVQAREIEAKVADDDEWTRLPSPKGGRCQASNWSRNTIINKIDAGMVRDKHVGASRFYSLADVRRLISEKSAA